ncbi:Beta-galactosidase C-terminal domain [Hymenobacter coccineus]|nr:Beta-galactosidase C-terminal domain [Hymenobacter coccineus]
MHYYFNYAAAPATATYPHGRGRELLSGEAVAKNQSLALAPWGVKIVEEQ